MSVPWDFSVSSPGIGDAGDDVAANTRRLVVLPSGHVDAPKSQNLRPRTHAGWRLALRDVIALMAVTKSGGKSPLYQQVFVVGAPRFELGTS
jgi:hypothetical protein